MQGQDRLATPRPDGVLSLDNHLILPGPWWPGAGGGQPSSARYQQNIRQQSAARISWAAQAAKRVFHYEQKHSHTTIEDAHTDATKFSYRLDV